MNQIYVISYDGRVFVANSSSTSFDPLCPDDENNNQIKIKRLSSSPYCIWAISSQFEIYLYVFNNDIPIEYQEITYEHQVCLKLIIY